MESKIGTYWREWSSIIIGKGMVEGVSNCNSNLDLCEHCLYGKHN